MTIRQIMTHEVASVHPSASLRDALEVLRAEEVSGAPVVQNGEVVGVVSATDILEFEATAPAVPTHTDDQAEWGEFEAPDVWEEGDESPSAYFIDFWPDAGAEVTERFERTDSPEWDRLAEHIVGEVMTRRVVALPPDAEVHDAARLMLEADVQRILVMEDSELRGIVTTTDIVRAVAERKV